MRRTAEKFLSGGIDDSRGDQVAIPTSISSSSTGDETGHKLLELVVARLLAKLRVVVTEEPL